MPRSMRTAVCAPRHAAVYPRLCTELSYPAFRSCRRGGAPWGVSAKVTTAMELLRQTPLGGIGSPL